MTYHVLKPKGSTQNVTLRNTEIGAEIIIGRVSTEIINILKEAGYGELNYIDEWKLLVNQEVGQALGKLTMKMHKPTKIKAKDLFQKPNKEIDAMDVLLGLANYN